MADAPTLDYTCPHCGKTETYELVRMQGERSQPAPKRPEPVLDFTCSECGTTETFQLVKTAGVR